MKRKYPEYSRTRRDHTPSNDGYFYDERPHPVSRQEQERQRCRRATRRRRQQRRRLTWAAGCIVIAAVCIALFRFWPGGVFLFLSGGSRIPGRQRGEPVDQRQ